MRALQVLAFALIFIAGWGASMAASGAFTNTPIVFQSSHQEEPSQKQKSMAQLLFDFAALESISMAEDDREKASPRDRVKMEDIKVYGNEVVISIDNPEWAYYADTNSMDPVIDSESNTIQIVPKSADELQVGDIVAYHSEFHEGTITHRIIAIEEDEKGWYATLKGDNNADADPGRVRFEQIKRIVVAVIY